MSVARESGPSFGTSSGVVAGSKRWLTICSPRWNGSRAQSMLVRSEPRGAVIVLRGPREPQLSATKLCCGTQPVEQSAGAAAD